LLNFVKVNTDNAAADLRYLLTEDLYLLNADKEGYRNPAHLSDIVTEPTLEPAIIEPVIEIPAASEPAAVRETPVNNLKYAGSNKKHFLVICYYPHEDFMPEAHQKGLESTLSRIGYVLDDIALVNMAHCPGVDFARLASQFAPQKLLLLGSQAMPVGLQINGLNQTQTIKNMLALYTYSFDEMMGNKENTKAFWNQIKTF
jgi:hypothetical protein